VSAISDGEPKYQHMQYGLCVTAPRDHSKIRSHKKDWVPNWLWRLLATPDFGDMLDVALERAKYEQRQRIIHSLNAPRSRISHQAQYARMERHHGGTVSE
jgi:hypothetical protein